MADVSGPSLPRPTFPIFLRPSFTLPFRRRRTETSDATAATGGSTSSTRGTGSSSVNTHFRARPSQSSTISTSSSVASEPSTSSASPSATPSTSPQTSTPASPNAYYFPNLIIPSVSRSDANATTEGGLVSSPVSYVPSSLAPGTDTARPAGDLSSSAAAPPAPPLQQPEATGSPSGTRKRLQRTHATTLRCSTCATDIALASQIVSKGFTGRYGRAYLVSPAAHLATSPSELLIGHPLAAAGTTNTRNKTSTTSGTGRTSTDSRNNGGSRGRKPKARKGAQSSWGLPFPAEDLPNVGVGRPEPRQLVTGAHVVADIGCIVCGARLGWKYVDARDAPQKYKVGKFILETERVVASRGWEDVEPDAYGAVSEDDYRDEEEDDEPDEDVNTGKSCADAAALGPTSSAVAAPDGKRKRRSVIGSLGKRKKKGSHSRRSSQQQNRSSTDGNNGEDSAGCSSTDDSSSDRDLKDDDSDISFDSQDEDECEDLFAGTWNAAVVRRRRRARAAAAAAARKR